MYRRVCHGYTSFMFVRVCFASAAEIAFIPVVGLHQLFEKSWGRAK